MRIKYLPLQPHCFAYGGFDIQMLATLKAVIECGVDASRLDIWSRERQFDILHCWGLSFSQYENFVWSKRSGKKLVATILMYDYETLVSKIKFRISSIIHNQRLMIDMLKIPDAVVVVNDRQADICNTYYKVHASKIHIIPNIVDKKFFIHQGVGIKDVNAPYVLTVGNVCSRKNQVLLAKACIQNNTNLVVIGKVLDGEAQQGNALSELTHKHPELITWIPELKENSDELIQFYKGCSIYALPSFVEQQPISLLEAAVLGKPLLIANRAYAHQKYYKNAYQVNPDSMNDIATAIIKIKENPTKYTVDRDVLTECKSRQVGLAYQKIYESVIN